MGLIAAQDWRNAMAVGFEIFAGGVGLALVIVAVGFTMSLYEKAVRR